MVPLKTKQKPTLVQTLVASLVSQHQLGTQNGCQLLPISLEFSQKTCIVVPARTLSDQKGFVTCIFSFSIQEQFTIQLPFCIDFQSPSKLQLGHIQFALALVQQSIMGPPTPQIDLESKDHCNIIYECQISCQNQCPFEGNQMMCVCLVNHFFFLLFPKHTSSFGLFQPYT